jgi:cyanophycin synthetase
VIPDEQESTSQALQIAETGDLVLILADNIKRTWKQIIYFNSEARPVEGTKKTTSNAGLPETGGFQFDESLEIISDERGVRIAREAGD